MTDHKNEALAWLKGLEDIVGQEGQTDATLIASPLIANAHATLYLAEQQRIANLLTYQAKSTKTVDVSEWPKERIDLFLKDAAVIDSQVREGLGLA